MRKLAEAERAELEKQVAGFEARLATDAGDREALRGSGAAALALGNAPRAAELLTRLTNAAPGDAQAWQLLVRGAGILSCGCNPISEGEQPDNVLRAA